MSIDEIDDLRKRVDNLQYKEIEPLKEKINQIEVSLKGTDTLMEMCIKTNENMSATLDSIRNTMTDLSKSVTDSNRISSELTVNVDKLNNKVEKLENKIDRVEDNGKIDILDWIRHNWFKIIVIMANILALLYIAEQTILN